MLRRATRRRLPTRRPAGRFDPPGGLRYPCRPPWVSSGEVAEWSKALAWKVSNIPKGVRGFESLPLRHTGHEFSTFPIRQLLGRRSGDSNPRHEKGGSTKSPRAILDVAAQLRRSGAKRRTSGVAASTPSLSAMDTATVNGGSRLHLRDDQPRTPSGPEGSSGSGIRSGAEVLLARAASSIAARDRSTRDGYPG